MLKKIIKTIFIIILIVVLIFIGLVVSFKLGRMADSRMQEAHVKQLRDMSVNKASIPDQMLDDSLRINEIRYLASHNSYHKQAGYLQLLVTEIFQPGEAVKLRYSHESFSRQLDSGVRSFELDIRYRGREFENCHVPLVDNRTHSPSVKLALDEMIIWSDQHPQHIPVIILIEHKDDWRFLDPFLKKWSTKAIIKLDTFFNEQLGDRLYTPVDMRDNDKSVFAGLKRSGWPELGSMRGKFIIVYHETEADYFTEEYLAGSDRVAFIMTEPDTPEASFMLRNEPEDAEISDLVDQGYIVRTRADADCIKDTARKNAAINSGAQIISTDFPMGYSSNSDYSLGWFELYR